MPTIVDNSVLVCLCVSLLNFGRGGGGGVILNIKIKKTVSIKQKHKKASFSVHLNCTYFSIYYFCSNTIFRVR